jgi:hypothetical protein
MLSQNAPTVDFIRQIACLGRIKEGTQVQRTLPVLSEECYPINIALDDLLHCRPSVFSAHG